MPLRPARSSPRDAAPRRGPRSPALLWAGLVAIGPAAWAAPASRLAPDAERGAQLYAEACAACHGAAGLGDGPLARATATPAPKLAGQVRPDPEAVARLAAGSGDMPGFSERYAASDLRRILVYLSGLDPQTGEGPGKPKPKPVAQPQPAKGVARPAPPAPAGPPDPPSPAGD